jgi:hypothetical protein
VSGRATFGPGATSHGALDDLVGDVAQLAVLVLRLLDEQVERGVGVAAGGALEDPLGLLDHGA